MVFLRLPSSLGACKQPFSSLPQLGIRQPDIRGHEDTCSHPKACAWGKIEREVAFAHSRPFTPPYTHCSWNPVSPEVFRKEPTRLPLQKGNGEQTKIWPVYPRSLHLPPFGWGISENDEGPGAWDSVTMQPPCPLEGFIFVLQPGQPLPGTQSCAVLSTPSLLLYPQVPFGSP